VQATSLFMMQNQFSGLNSKLNSSGNAIKSEGKSESFLDLLQGNVEDVKELENVKTTEESTEPTSDLLERLLAALPGLDESDLEEVYSYLAAEMEGLFDEQDIKNSGSFFDEKFSEENMAQLLTLLGELPQGKLKDFRELPQLIESLIKRKSPEVTRGFWFPIEDHNRIQLEGDVDIQPFQQLFQQVEKAVSSIESLKDIEKIAPELLGWLENWQQLANQAGVNTADLLTNIKGNKENIGIFRDLFQFYQQKTDFQKKNVYTLESKVSTNDLVRWLGSMLNAKIYQEKPITSFQTQSPMPIAKVEQFVIHLPTQTNTSSSNQSLMEQFGRLIDGNKSILFQPNGQLSIALKPANLGEMVVRFTQVNGEMMVKIVVTSAIAKEMLEGNMQQLRHMFSPHQVTIERQDTVEQHAEEAKQDDREDEEKDPRDEHSSERNNRENDKEISFSTMFEELLLNEKV